MSDFSVKLRALRRSRDLTQAAVAKRAGLSVRTICELEAGRGNLGSLDAAFRVFALRLDPVTANPRQHLATVRPGAFALARAPDVRAPADTLLTAFGGSAPLTAPPTEAESTAMLRDVIRQNHYSGITPSGKTLAFAHGDAIVTFSVPANRHISKQLVGKANRVWELSRLWAPDGHDPNLLTKAIAHAVRQFHQAHPEVWALISYADPHAGHHGGVYRAASWQYLGRSKETRAYRRPDGTIANRRSFHVGRRQLTAPEIAATGAVEFRVEGKHRFARGLTRKARGKIRDVFRLVRA